ncbi:MAG: hypothetical protein ACK4NX_01175, partial [Candidatus Paceibacteria bacterium]
DFPPVFGGLAFGLEILFFALIFFIALLAVSKKIPLISAEKQIKSKYEIFSDIYVPSKIIVVSFAFLLLAIILGWFILFKFTAAEAPIRPAALIQFHTHTGFFSIGFLMAFLAMVAVGVSERFLAAIYKIGLISLFGTVAGFLVFIVLKTHSIVWILPAMIYYGFLVACLIAIIRSRTDFPDKLHFNFAKGALIFIWFALLIFIAAGPYLSFTYNTKPDITVTYRQPQGASYPGPYPEKIIGTAPVKGTARGIEFPFKSGVLVACRDFLAHRFFDFRRQNF